LDAINLALNYSIVKQNISLQDFFENKNISIVIQVFFDEDFFVITKD
jgi:hypothetical protein